MEPIITIVMPSLNVGPYIRECLESAMRQKLKEIEILCVDAGSTDGTLETIRELAAQDERIRVINSDRKSYGYQVNLGLKEARGRYFAILETDDYIPRDMYGKLVALAERNRLDVVKTDYYGFTGTGKERKFLYCPLTAKKSLYNTVFAPREQKESFYALKETWSGIYNTEYLRAHEILHHESPGASYQDNGFWFQSFIHADRMMFVRHPYYRYRTDNPNSSVFNTKKMYCICDEYDYIRSRIDDPKWYGLCAYMRFHNYEWVLTRLATAPEARAEFLQRMQEEFRKLEEQGELEKDWFTQDEWDSLQAILKDPSSYSATQLHRPVFKGNAFERFLRCVRLYGWSYTVKRMLHLIR